MSFPKELNLGNNKPIAAAGKPYINRYRSDNTTYLNNDTIQIEIPCGKHGQYLFPKTGFIEGQVAISATNAATVAANGVAGQVYIDQSVYSLFNRIIVKHGGVVLEDCMYVNKVWTSIMDIQINESERHGLGITNLIGDIGTAFGTTYNSGLYGAAMTTDGIAAVTTVDNTSTGNGVYYDFAFPLPSAILGTLASKALPVGEAGASSIYILLQLESPSVAFVADSIAAFTPTINKYEVKNVYYNTKCVVLPDDVNNLLLQSTGGSILLPAVAYKAESKTISAAATMFNDKFSFQFASIKSFNFFVQNSAAAAGTAKSRAISCRPKANISEYFLQINGEAYPSQAISSTSRMYAELLRAWDQLCDTNAGGIISRNNYSANLATVAGAVLTAAGIGNYGLTAIQYRFLAGIDLDRFNHSSDVLMSGTQTTGQLINLLINFSAGNAEALTLYAFVMYDVLYNIENGQIKVSQ
jgi:hypothetical protein